jgi:hypothetical protein
VKKGLSVIVNKTAAITNNTTNGKSSITGNINTSKTRIITLKDRIDSSSTRILAPLADESNIESKDGRKGKDVLSKKCKR